MWITCAEKWTASEDVNGRKDNDSPPQLSMADCGKFLPIEDDLRQSSGKLFDQG